MIGKRNVAELMHGFTPKNILGLTAPYSTPFHNNRNAGNHCVDLAEQERIVRALVKKQLRDKRYNRGPDLAAVLCDLANGEQYITEAVAQEVYEAFEPPLDNELRELLFDIIREDNGRNAVNKKLSETVEFREDGTNYPKIINWRLMAKILDFNRFQPWERPFGHGYIDETQCVQQSSECMQ
uniref:EF hand domain containing family member B n=1 Tax=Echinococcus granulosus TaxID=6210 RepID=A0A068WD31_ECHGR|nr:EF hand domain containing family member B [Echinococcus granulosus]